ncbi:hypothetical protein ABZ446_14835 [Streptomyces sp. NPDC005813]|uniref:hypothetical protein n=1 Tax=Streptomyces sp. NPDC005813 TaxID=3155592 RepID=UPI0033E7C506
MTGYATHAQNARELLEALDAKSVVKKRLYDANAVVAVAQVEAILALAAAIAEQGSGAGSR